ncbi:MAG: LCP family protein [Lachnospiraceae bacterium]|nr:LCP family protein [Lachnospiraceae bacterium]
MKVRISAGKAGILLLIFAAVVIALIVYLLLPEKNRYANDGSGTQTQWFDDNTLYLDDTLYGFTHRIETFLFAGTDNSGNETDPDQPYHGAMADFLMFLVMDHTDGSYGVIQIDRNTMAEVMLLDENDQPAGWNTMQICTAHWYGSNPEVSARNQVRAVRDLLGELEVVDGYYILNMRDIATLNEAVDGVEVVIEDPDMTVVDPAFVQGQTVTLTGDQAEKFLRARMSVGEGTNEERMRRQRTYLDAFFQKAADRIYDNPKAVQAFWNTVRDVAQTNMNGNDVSRIAKMVMDGENKGLYTFEGKTVLGTTLADGLEHEEFYPDTDSVLSILQDLFSLVVAEEDEDMTEDISELLFSDDMDDEDLYEDEYDSLYDDLYEDETRSE